MAVSSLVGLTGGLVAAGQGLEWLGYPLLAWSGFKGLGLLTTVVHEMGHALAALLLGRRVYRIAIGLGPPLRTFRLGRTLLTFGRDLDGGYVVDLPLRKVSRGGSITVLAAGAAANLVAATGLIVLAGYVSTASGAAAAVLAGFILSNLLTGVVTLIPMSQVRYGDLWESDGKQILQQLRTPVASVDLQLCHDTVGGKTLLEAKLWEAAEAHYRDAFTRYPDQPGFLAVLMHVLAASKGYEAAMACVEEHGVYLGQERDVSGAMAPFWAYAWSMAAWVSLRSPTGDLTAAGLFAQRALSVGGSPYPSAIQGAIRARVGERESGLFQILDGMRHFGSAGDKLEFIEFILEEGLESADLRATDFRSYADHLRALA